MTTALRKVSFVLLILLVLLVANIEKVTALLAEVGAVEAAAYLVATCLTGGTLTILVALFWLLPSRLEE